MKKNKNILFYSVLVVIIVILDEIIKYSALQKFPDSIHKNLGISFDIPFRMSLIYIASVLIGIFLVDIAYKNRKKHPQITFAATMIIIGALGNLFDRVVYGFTVDYIIIGKRLAINLSDVVILIGVAKLLLASRRKNSHKFLHPDEPKYDN